MKLEKKTDVVAAASRQGINFKAASAVWLLAGAFWLAGAGSPQAAALRWAGGSLVNNVWDINTTANWKNGAATVNFNTGDSVTFDNFGAPLTTVNVNALVQPTAITVDTSAVNYAFTNATGSIIGPGGLLVFGPGKLTLATTNSYSGGTTVSNALLQLNSATAAGTGPITNSSGTVYVNYGGLANSLTCFGTATFTNSGHTGGIGTLNGSGTLAINSPGQVFDLTGNITGYGGTLILSNCTSGVRFNVTTGSSAATFDLGNGTVGLSIRNGATAIALGGLAGGNGTTLSGNTAVAYGATFTIGGINISSTFGGKIANSMGTAAINKVGTGTLTLSGTNNSYSGNTTVSAGVLAITGLAWPTNSAVIDVITNSVLDVSGLAGGLVTLSSNQTLTGSGTLRGSVVAPANAIVLPGDGVGVLTVTNAITLGGSLLMELNNSLVTATNDRLVAATINYGGTLTVTNVGPALAAGQSFLLFSGARSATFAAVNLPTNGPNSLAYTWTNKLNLDGSIQVLTVTGGVNTNPPPLLASRNGTALTLSWPTNAGWTLQMQTNSLTVGLATNWVDFVPGSAGVTATNLTIDPARPTVFYRLKY